MQAGNVKFQNPNAKGMTNDRMSKDLTFEICTSFELWDLTFEIFSA